VSLDWSAFDATLADMNNAIKNSTPNTNLKSFNADNRPADSERRDTPVHYPQIKTSGRLYLVAEIATARTGHIVAGVGTGSGTDSCVRHITS